MARIRRLKDGFDDPFRVCCRHKSRDILVSLDTARRKRVLLLALLYSRTNGMNGSGNLIELRAKIHDGTICHLVLRIKRKLVEKRAFLDRKSVV